MSFLLFWLTSVALAERSNISEQTCVLEKEAAQAVRRLWEMPEETSASVKLPVFGAKGAENLIAWDAKKKSITIGTLFANMRDVPPAHLPRLEFRVNSGAFQAASPKLWASVLRDLEDAVILGDPPEPASRDEELAGRLRFPMPVKGERVEFSLYKIKKRQEVAPADVGGDLRGLALVIRCGPRRN